MNLNVGSKGTKLFDGLKDGIDANAPALCTLGSIVALGLTCWFMHRASKEAATEEVRYEEKVQVIEERKASGLVDEERAKADIRQAKVSKAIGLFYIYRWAEAAGILSAVLSLMSFHISGTTIATMGVLLAGSQEKVKKTGQKVKEMIGEDKFKEFQSSVENEIFGDKLKSGDMRPVVVSRNVFGKCEEGLVEDDYEMVWDTYIDHPRQMPKGRVEAAIKQANEMTFLKWGEWEKMLGYSGCGNMGIDHVWGNRNRFKAHIGTVSKYGVELKSIVYDEDPVFANRSKNKH